jgi:hypothetical protein
MYKFRILNEESQALLPPHKFAYATVSKSKDTNAATMCAKCRQNPLSNSKVERGCTDKQSHVNICTRAYTYMHTLAFTDREDDNFVGLITIHRKETRLNMAGFGNY